MKYIIGSAIILLIIALTVWFMTTKKQKDGFSMVSMDEIGDLSIDTFILGDDGGVSEIKTSNSGLKIPGTLKVSNDMEVDGTLSARTVNVDGTLKVGNSYSQWNEATQKICIGSTCIGENDFRFLRDEAKLD
jgi:hypothetical protein